MLRFRLLLLAVFVLVSSIAMAAPAQDESARCAAALIVINLDQETVDFAGTGAPFPEDWRTSTGTHVIDANTELISSARDAGLLIIYLYGNYPDLDESELGTYEPEIAPTEGDILIARPGYNLNVFTMTPLLETLMARDIDHLMFSGLNTGFCVNTSAQWALRLGFEATVVADAHSGGTPEYAQSYNDYWPTLGIHVVATEDLDFVALCTPVGDEEEHTEGAQDGG